MSLRSPALTELTSESGTFKLLNEWLAQWFDGNAHILGVNTPAIVFPKVNRAFGQGAPAQPLHDLGAGTDAEIRVVMHSRSETATSLDTTLYQGKLITDYVILNFWVSAKKPGEGQSELLAETVAELLKAVLTNPDARYDLAPKGISHLQPHGPPAPLPSADYAKRLVSCNAQLTYAVQYGDSTLAALPGDLGPAGLTYATQMVQFWREAPLLANTYLLGYYAWSISVRVKSARVMAWAPQGQDVVLAIEVDGELIEPNLTIPQGLPNTEVSADLTFEGVIIAPGQAVRWKVVSAPDGEATAWQANLAMEVQRA